MKKFAKRIFQILWQEERAQDLVEYALLVVLIGLGAIAAINYLAGAIWFAFVVAAARLTGYLGPV
ncbi:MAG TPA: Flp family type IVb pilin [Patescibacteria group bacterium]|nr:Flp family type IVb pilin [Patescibacteria group bacterium]